MSQTPSRTPSEPSSGPQTRFRHILQVIRRELGWLTPGLGVKRWLLLIMAGTTLLGVGLALFLLDLYRNAPENDLLPLISFLSLRFLDRPLRVIFFGGLGIGMVMVGVWGFTRAFLRPFLPPGKHILDYMSDFRKRGRGPRIVAIGGGHGLAALLRGLKTYSNNITAIVTVADDGGSSGSLRRSLGILPPGDIRNCLAALSNDETLMTQVFQYRFASGAGLEGHSLGNLFISALAEITGSFEQAVAESARVLAINGRVLPASLHDVRLVADVLRPETGKRQHITGESNITQARGKIQRIWLEPGNAPAFPPAIAAILSADLIVIGPGSLYTSLLPNLLVSDLAQAIRVSHAVKFMICNVSTQPGETDGYTAFDHMRAIQKHVGDDLFDLLICNSRYEGPLPNDAGWVKVEKRLLETYPCYQTDLVDMDNPWRHDSAKLAQVVMDLFQDRTGPLAG